MSDQPEYYPSYQSTENFECDKCSCLILIGDYVSIVNGQLWCGGCMQDDE